MVTLPRELVETQKIKENEVVEITVKKCRREDFGILKGMAPFTEEDELKTIGKFVVDAWAWVEYLMGSAFGVRVREVLDQESDELYTCAVTLAEVMSKVAREGKDVEAMYVLLLSNSQVVDVNEELSKYVGLLHCEMRQSLKDFGLVDAYVLAIAGKLKAKVLTGDIHFKGVKEAVLLR